MLAGVSVGRQLRALARLEDAEDDGADKGAYELWYCLVDCEALVSEKLFHQRFEEMKRGNRGGCGPQ